MPPSRSRRQGRSARRTASRSRRRRPRALDRAGDRRGGGEARRRPDRARIGTAVAEAVALLLPDSRPRPTSRAVPGARRRLPARGFSKTAASRPDGSDVVYAPSVKASSSDVAGSALRWRFSWRARAGASSASTRRRRRSTGSATGVASSSSATGWTAMSSVMRDRRGRRSRGVHRWRQHEHRDRAGIAEALRHRVHGRASPRSASRRLLREARLADRVPTQTAISVLTDAVRACDVRPLEPSGAA